MPVRHATKLTIIADTGKSRKVLCRCECGIEKMVSRHKVLSGRTKSCGCAKALWCGNTKRTHGRSGTKEYWAWTGMMARCYRKNHPKYPGYGGRGIKVCKRWRNSFDDFLADMGFCPISNLSVGRKNNDGNYEPSNCEWQDAKQQARTRRSTRTISYNGKTQSLAAWSEETGIDYGVLRYRLSHWTVEKSLTTPIRGLHRVRNC